MSGPAKDDIPCLSKLYRLQGKGTGCVCSLPRGYGEINESAGEILSRVDGSKSISSSLMNLRRSLGVTDW